MSETAEPLIPLPRDPEPSVPETCPECLAGNEYEVVGGELECADCGARYDFQGRMVRGDQRPNPEAVWWTERERELGHPQT